MFSNEELSDAFNLLIDLDSSEDDNMMRERLCYLLISGAKNADELKSIFDEAARLSSIKKRDRVWLAAIKAGERFKKGDWTKNREDVIDLMEMDRIYKKYAGKEIE